MMNTPLRFCSYFAVLALLAAGAAGGLTALTADEGVSPPAETRQPAPNRITAWQERKAEELLYAAKEAAAKEAAARSVAAKPAPVALPIVARAEPVAVPVRTKPKKQVAKRPRQAEGEVALAYAPEPSSRIAYENVFNTMRDRAGN